LKRVFVLLALGVLAPVVQGVIGTFVAPTFSPDLGLLLVVGLGLCWRGTATGVALAAVLGFTADLFSGSLLGQHALLRVLTFGAARVCSQQLNLKGAFLRIAFGSAITFAHAAASAALTAFFVAGADWVSVPLADLVPQALVNGLLAPFVISAVQKVSLSLGDDPFGRPLVLSPRDRTR
jgi:cell shape-determining protein MreD